MKCIETRTDPRKAYRPSVPDRQENRPTFDRSQSQLWYASFENCRRFN